MQWVARRGRVPDRFFKGDIAVGYVWFGCLRLRSLIVVTCAVVALVSGVVYSARGLGRPAQSGPLAGYTIAVDAGHGGSDRGACYMSTGLIEKEINLDVANRIEALLGSLGARVIQIRSDDTFVELDRRSEIANEAGADLLVSIHVNRIPGHPECFGAQTFYFPGRETSQRLATLLQEELVAIDPDNYRRPLPGEYRILRLAKMPASIVEIGFMTNERDRALLATPEYRERAAAAVVKAIVRFLGEAGSPTSPRIG